MLRRSTAARFVCHSCTRQLALRQQLVQKRQGRRWLATATAAPTASTPAPPSPDDFYDVVCVGGGPAGLSLLTALRSNPVTAGLRLALVEAQNLNRLRTYSPKADRFANRCSSLTPTSVRFLVSIGAWPHLHRNRVQAYHAMQVWDGVTGARVSFDWPPEASLARPDTGSTIAYMVENDNLTAGLLRRLEELGGVDVFDMTRVDQIGFGRDDSDGLNLSGWPAVQLSSNTAQKTSPLLARLLVGADGANSPVRAFADIQARGWNYGRHGVVATLQLEEGSGSLSGDAFRTAYQRFLPTGPVAMLPLPGRRATLVWSTTPERAARLKALAPADFVALVNAAFRLSPVDLAYLHGLSTGQQDEVAWRMEATGQQPTEDAFNMDSLSGLPPPVVAVQEGSVASFPLRLRHADTYIAERVALVGDAAHTVHPLAGQGLNQGQADVASLARTIAYAVAHGQDLGVHAALEAYPADRYAANHVLMGVCDKLHKLYAVESGPLVPLRSLGLRAVNALRPIKNFFMEQAAGSSSSSSSSGP